MSIITNGIIIDNGFATGGTYITGITSGTTDNELLVTKGYVDDNITTGTTGFWERSGTDLSPINTGDTLTSIERIENSTNGVNNILIGNNAGLVNTANSNTFIGNITGEDNTTGRRNVAIGDGALANNINSDNNTMIGYLAGKSQISGINTFIGSAAGEDNISGTANTCVGDRTGGALNTGSYNVLIGSAAGITLTSSYNTFVGTWAGITCTTGGYNVGLGFRAGAQNSTGSNNVYIGYETGRVNTGDGCVFLGYQAGENVIASNKLFIDNSNTNTPLIYGEFDNNLITINGDLQIVSDGTKGVFRVGQFTHGEAGALTPSDADMIYSTTTGGTFTSIGFWGYEDGTWTKL